MFKKYTSGVYCVVLPEVGLTHGTEKEITTKYGKTVSIIIWKELGSKNGSSYYSYVRQDGFNRKAWLEKKAQTARDRAEKQETKSKEEFKKSQRDADFLSLGEPIKVGHHSERKHRKAIEYAQRHTAKFFEALDKASDYSDKAESLDAIAESNINLDSPDSLFALAAKVETLEEQRKNIKREGGSAPYVLTNLGANIRRYKDRLATAEKLWKI